MIYITFFFTVTLLVYAAIILRHDRKMRLQKRFAAFLSNEKEKKMNVKKRCSKAFF